MTPAGYGDESDGPHRFFDYQPLQGRSDWRNAAARGDSHLFGVAHAGAILWFADVCATILAFGGVDFAEGAAGFPLAINLNAALLGNQKSGVLTATSSFVKRGRQLTVVRTKVTGEGGRLIAEVTTSHLASQ